MAFKKIKMCNAVKNLLNEFTINKHTNNSTKNQPGKTNSDKTLNLKSEEKNDKINIANVIVSPTSVEERDAARRASVKALSSRLSLKKNENINSLIETDQQKLGENPKLSHVFQFFLNA